MNGRRARGRAVAVLAALVVGLAGMAAGDRAFAAAGGTVSAAADGYVVRVKVGGSRGCTGVLLDYQIVATSKECFQVGATPPVSGPPPADSTVVSRPDQGASTSPVAVDYLIVRDDRNVVLAHLATILVVSRAKVSAAAPTAGEALRVVGFGRTAGEWVPRELVSGMRLSVNDGSSRCSTPAPV